MAYFLKKTKLKGRTYLAIYESFYNPEKKKLLINATNLWVQFRLLSKVELKTLLLISKKR